VGGVAGRATQGSTLAIDLLDDINKDNDGDFLIDFSDGEA
jgi:hypothetical protein